MRMKNSEKDQRNLVRALLRSGGLSSRPWRSSTAGIKIPQLQSQDFGA